MHIKKKGLIKAKRRMFFLTLILFILVVFIIGSVSKDWIKIFENRHQVVELTNQYNELCKQEEQLKSDVNKLQDPDYVARYAREKYSYTKDGELIIRIPKSESE